MPVFIIFLSHVQAQSFIPSETIYLQTYLTTMQVTTGQSSCLRKSSTLKILKKLYNGLNILSVLQFAILNSVIPSGSMTLLFHL